MPELGQAALTRFDDAPVAGEAEPVLVKHLSAGLRSYQQSLDLTPADDHDERATSENQIGITYRRAWATAEALRHYQKSVQHEEAQETLTEPDRAATSSPSCSPRRLPRRKSAADHGTRGGDRPTRDTADKHA
jgi:hypothetical protein